MTNMPEQLPLADYLKPAEYIDSDHPTVQAFAERAADSADDPLEIARRLYNAVRDQVTYTPYADYADPATYRASGCLAAGRGYCVGKAALLSACARHLGIPARLGLANVRNHLTTPRLQQLMDSDVFYYHGFTELYLDGQWVRVTPTFDARLCRRLNVSLLEFDGRNDALFHEYDNAGQRYMEYLTYHGTWQDVPVEMLMAAMRRHYPQLAGRTLADADFAAEAGSESP